ncbi:MAG TPA: glycoside hydrolase family 127 protein [bacterium]|nr:glycoside hydrolase family 127 protein [bacterium]HPR88051.1 glycoside hydrolase family 127 protein [bacterium]
MTIRQFLTLTVMLFAGAALAQYPGQFAGRLKTDLQAPVQAFAFDLSDVRITAGPFRHAMEMDAAYLLSLDPRRLLHRFHAHAGLPVQGEVYGGWESEGLSGHTLGHYLSACAMHYANSGDPEFKKRVDDIVAELARCQQARGSGYVGAIPGEDTLFARVARGDIKSSGFNLNGGWSPWYTVHKVMAGLVDAYLYAGNAAALQVVCDMADWAAAVVNPLSETQRLAMLNCEYGGMNELLANLYAITGQQKYLALSRKFHDEFVLGQLARRIDPLPGKHSNTNVPKAVGAARRYELSADSTDCTIARFFWECMVRHHTYVIGGNSNYEYCGEEDQLNDRLSDNTCETCNTYNMLKLTRHLFCLAPDQELADFYERALYNHILASQNPADGMMCYFIPLRMGTRKLFSDSFNTFTCCVGSGMENHVKYAESIYYKAADGGLYLNLFIPSVLCWKERGLTLTQETAFPESDRVLLTLATKKPQHFPLYLRQPSWSGAVEVTVNGKKERAVRNGAGFWSIERTWRDNDRVELRLPMHLRTEAMPDNPDRIAFLYGPVVLAGQLGDTLPDPVYGTPVLLTGERHPEKWIAPLAAPLTFKTSGIGMPGDFILKPFYATSTGCYSVYFDYFTPEGWSARQEAWRTEKNRLQQIESRTIDNFRIGEMQPERDHQLEAGEQSYVDQALGRFGREARAGSWISFTMAVQTGRPNALLLTVIGDDRERRCDLSIEETKIAEVEWKGGETGRFYDLEYPLPAGLIAGKTRVSVRIDANHGRTAGRFFGCRTVTAAPAGQP